MYKLYTSPAEHVSPLQCKNCSTQLKSWKLGHGRRELELSWCPTTLDLHATIRDLYPKGVLTLVRIMSVSQELKKRNELSILKQSVVKHKYPVTSSELMTVMFKIRGLLGGGGESSKVA